MEICKIGSKLIIDGNLSTKLLNFERDTTITPMPGIKPSPFSHNWGLTLGQSLPAYLVSVAVIRVPARYMLIPILLKIARSLLFPNRHQMGFIREE